MKANQKQSGVTLIEMIVVIAAIALFAMLGLPAIRAVLDSMGSKGSVKGMISAAMASARAIAAKEQRYAGIRFQEDLNGHQYIIFIVHDFEATGLAPGFRAVEGIKPIKLPDDLGVIDSFVRVNHGTHWTAAEDTSHEPIVAVYLENPIYLTDVTAFSIIFSPSGRMIIHDVRVRNRNGIYQPENINPAKVSMDDIFNSRTNIVDYKVGTFIQDDYAEFGLGAESSRNSFRIYDKSRFAETDAGGRYNYLSGLKPVYINPYTGTIIEM